MNIAPPQIHSYIEGIADVRNDIDVILNYEKNEGTDNLAIIPFHNLVLFPYESIPIRLRKSFFRNIPGALESISQQEQSINSNNNQYFFPFHLGIVFHTVKEGSIGVSCEIKSSTLSVYDIFTNVSNNDDNDYVHMVAKGCYRFKIKSIRIHRGITITAVKFFFDYEDRFPRLRDMNPFPNWVYEKHSPAFLSKHAWSLYSKMLLLSDMEEETEDINNNHHISELTQNPTRLSYYLAANLPLENNIRLSLLHCNNTYSRLISCIQILQYSQDQVLQCLVCSQNLGKISDVFTVPGAEGNIGAYINPAGIIHQTITLRILISTARLVLQGRPEKKDSWFPNYSWTIVCCGICSSHLGWHFTHNENHTVSFYGFRRTALKKADYSIMNQSRSRMNHLYNNYRRRVGNMHLEQDETDVSNNNHMRFALFPSQIEVRNNNDIDILSDDEYQDAEEFQEDNQDDNDDDDGDDGDNSDDADDSTNNDDEFLSIDSNLDDTQ